MHGRDQRRFRLLRLLRGRGPRLAALAIVLVLTAASCGKSSTGGSSANTNKASAPGITPTTITIGSTQPLTGPAAPGYSEIAPASNAYFQYVNDNGGVFGRKIVYKYLDDGYNPAQTTANTRKLVLQDQVFAIFSALGTPTHLAVVDYLNSQKVPDLFVSSGCNCWNDVAKHPYTFGFQPDYTIEGKILGQYIQQQFAGKKIGYFYQNDEFGLDGVKGLDQQIPAASVVSRQSYVPTNTNVGPQLAALQSKGAEVVVMFSIPAFTTLGLLAAAKIGYHPQFVVSNVGSDPITLTGLLKAFTKGAVGPALLNGLISDTYLPPVTDDSNPWIQLFKKIHDQYIPKLPFDGNVEYGMAQAYTFVQLLKAAGRNPTRASIVHTLETTKLSGGPGLVPFGFSPSNHLGYLGVQLARLDNGKVVPFGPIQLSSDSGPITQSNETPASPPANGIAS
jgi:ABC-type branched-subunit amino acid transport system substrate-binding protein